VKLEREKAEELVRRLKERGAVEERAPQNVRYRLKKGSGILMIYETGSIVYGGKEREEIKREVIDEILKMEEVPRIGCDEAGKGELFGPLVVACVCADKSCLRRLLELQVKDSKKLSRESLIKLAEAIRENCRGIVRVLNPEDYNRKYERFRNLNRLLEEVYSELLSKLLKKCKPRKVVVDKFSERVEGVLRERFPEVKFEVRTKGESDIVVAAASIVAKAERLRVMDELSQELGFELPEGNRRNAEILSKIPKEERKKYIKEHFEVGE